MTLKIVKKEKVILKAKKKESNEGKEWKKKKK